MTDAELIKRLESGVDPHEYRHKWHGTVLQLAARRIAESMEFERRAKDEEQLLTHQWRSAQKRCENMEAHMTRQAIDTAAREPFLDAYARLQRAEAELEIIRQLREGVVVEQLPGQPPRLRFKSPT